MDISSLATISNSAVALSNLILVTPDKNVGYQPQNPSNPDGTISTDAAPPTLLFNYEGENTLTLDSDITDHFVEDNTAIQDQIALRPEVITVQGYIGELNDIAPAALQPLKTIADKLAPVVGAYVPVISQTALIAYNEAAFLYATANNFANAAVSAWSSINGNSAPTQNKQQVAFQAFYGYWNSRTLFTVQTPWGIFKNMAIKTLRAVQDPETKVISEFDVTFKQIKFAQTQIDLVAGQAVLVNPGNNRLSQQSVSLQRIGPNTGVTASQSLADEIGIGHS